MEIHKQIVGVYGNVWIGIMWYVSSPKETSRWEKVNDDDLVQEEFKTWFKWLAADFYD